MNIIATAFQNMSFKINLSISHQIKFPLNFSFFENKSLLTLKFGDFMELICEDQFVCAYENIFPACGGEPIGI
jgi:hypothetical protein